MQPKRRGWTVKGKFRKGAGLSFIVKFILKAGLEELTFI